MNNNNDIPTPPMPPMPKQGDLCKFTDPDDTLYFMLDSVTGFTGRPRKWKPNPAGGKPVEWEAPPAGGLVVVDSDTRWNVVNHANSPDNYYYFTDPEKKNYVYVWRYVWKWNWDKLDFDITYNPKWTAPEDRVYPETNV